MRKRLFKLKYMILTVLVFTCAFSGLLTSSSKADGGIYITHEGAQLDPSGVLEMKSATIQLNMATDGAAYDDDKYKVEWTIEDPTARGVIATVEQSTGNKMIAIVHALSPGDVTITLTVKDSMAGNSVLGSTTCNVRVLFSVDTTTNDSIYKYVKEDDIDRSLVLYSDDTPVQLGLNFGQADSTNTQWMSANTEVCTVTQDGGLVTPVGAGKTLVTATYTPTGGTDTYTAYLNVYIIPRVSKTDGTDYKKSEDITINSGDSIYTDTVFTNNLEVIRSKIVWVVKKDDGAGNSQVIADSLGTQSDLIEVVPEASRSNRLNIKGRAGEYDLYFYTYDTYDSTLPNGTQAYTPTVVHLTIKSDIGDKDVILHVTNGVGDTYDFAEAFNMTTDEFKSCFSVGVTLDNGASAIEYADYNPTSFRVTAKKTGKLKATLNVLDASYVKKLLGLSTDDPIPTRFYTNIDIVEGIFLDRSAITISVGQTYQLNAIIGDIYDESISWTTSDANYVTVQNGLIEGKKVTTTDVIVSAILGDGEGVYKRASCQVKVEAALDDKDVTINPNKPQRMLVGDSTTFVATIKNKTVSVAPLVWKSTDEKVFKVTTAADGKSAIVTAVGGGSAVLTVYNSNTEVSYENIKIDVIIPISTIKFSSETMAIPHYKEGYNLIKDVTFNPTNATDSDLVWATSDSSIAKIDEDGYMSFTDKPGTVLVNVYPKYNPYNIMASTMVTILGSPTDISLDEKTVTLNVGDTRPVPLTFFPENTATEIEFKPTFGKEDICTTTFDETRKLVNVTAKKPGSVDIMILTKNNLSANLTVNVKQPSTDVTVSPKELVVLTGETAALSATLKPADSTDTLVWKSYNTSIASVDKDGKVTGMKSGNTFIQVTAYNGSITGPTSVIQVIVKDGVKSVELDSYEKTVGLGNSITLSPKFNPETAFDKTMKWSVANSSIVKIEPAGISDVKVTGLKVGSTIVTGVTQDGGYSVSCMITVFQDVKNVTRITLNPKSKIIAIGKSFKIKATVTGTTNKKVKWKSSKKKICTVTQKGKVKAKKIGTAYITVTSKNGSKAKATCKVRVVRKVKKIKLNKSSATVLVGNSINLKAKIVPKNATIKKVVWKTSDKSIATVGSTGRVIGVAPGICKITVTTTDGTNKKAMCLLHVKEAVEATGVSVANQSLIVPKGRCVQSGIVIEPANSTTSIKYHSDNKKVATVDKHGKITTHRAGQVTIYGTTANGMEGYCDVQVVDLNRKAIRMRVYDKETLHVNDVTEGVVWYSRNINIATVDASGVVTGRRKGTTTVYAVVKGVKLGCRVTIKAIK